MYNIFSRSFLEYALDLTTSSAYLKHCSNFAIFKYLESSWNTILQIFVSTYKDQAPHTTSYSTNVSPPKVAFSQTGLQLYSTVGSLWIGARSSIDPQLMCRIMISILSTVSRSTWAGLRCLDLRYFCHQTQRSPFLLVLSRKIEGSDSFEEIHRQHTRHSLQHIWLSISHYMDIVLCNTMFRFPDAIVVDDVMHWDGGQSIFLRGTVRPNHVRYLLKRN